MGSALGLTLADILMIVFVHELKGHHNLLQINTHRTIHACFKLHTMRKKSFLAKSTCTPCTQNLQQQLSINK